jgi:hypothetical protein
MGTSVRVGQESSIGMSAVAGNQLLMEEKVCLRIVRRGKREHEHL